MACSSNPTPACMSSTSPEDLNQPTPPTNSSPDNKPPSRNYDKCSQCRHDRKSCLRDHPDQKCTRCKELGHPCGPPLKAPRKRKRSAVVENMSIPSGINSSAHTPATGNAQPLDQTTSTWDLGRGADFGRLSYGVAVNLAAQQLFERARFDLETCRNFECAAASTRILSTQSQYLCRELRDRMTLQVSQLQFNQLHGINVPQTQRRATPFSLSAEIAQSVDPTSGDFITLICTANVLKPCQPVGLQNQGHIRNSVNELPQSYYLSTEAALRELMMSISQDAPGQWSTLHQQAVNEHGPFPASHIAYLNLDRETAYQLWLSSMENGTVVDVLGRSFPHIVAEAGDSKLLDKMSARVLKDAGRDARGLSLLDLGVIGDSSLIVRTVVEKNIVLAPFTRAMQRAIIGRRLDIADYLLPHLRSTSWNDAFELNILAELAGQSGFLFLQDQLETILPFEPGPQDALNDLDALGLQLDSDDPVIPGSASFDSSDISDWTLPPGFPSIPNVFGDSEYGLSQSSQTDPGGGTHDFSYSPLYPPS